MLSDLRMTSKPSLLFCFVFIFCAPLATCAQTPTDVSFAADLAGTLAERCSGCHGGARPRRELRIESYSSLLDGGENGPVIEENDPASSLIIQKMKGTADGDRMPPNGDPLAPELIAKFETWIQSGAKFDGPDRDMSLVRLASATRLSRLSADELALEAVELAKKNWSLAFSGERAETSATDHFLFAYRKNSANVETIGKQAEKAYASATKVLGVPKAKLKSPFVVYVVPSRYDFGEFVQMVEKRDVSTRTSTRFWRPDGGLGYAVLGPKGQNSSNKSQRTRSKEKEAFVSDAELSRLTTSLLLNRWGAPVWYAEGVGQLAFEKANRRDPLVTLWKKRAPRALTGTKDARALFEGQLPAEDADAATWGFARFLARDGKRMRALHESLADGRPFKAAFPKFYGKPAPDLGDAWLVWLKRGNK